MFKRLLLMVAVMAGMAGSGHAVHAASVNFQVAPEFPTNQIDKKLNYYNLHVTPGTTQKLSFLILNSDSGSHKFNVSVNRAGTGSDGDTSYSVHGAKPTTSLKVNIEALFPKPQTYTVAPHSTRRITLPLKAPTEGWSGILLGAIHVVQLDNNSNANGNVGVSSHPAYTIGMQLQTLATLPTYTPALQFNGTNVKTTVSGSMISAKLENPNPTLETGLHVSAKVFHAGKKVLQNDMAGIKLAPNAEMAFPLTETAKALKPGKYSLIIDAQNGEQQWHFADDFTITQTVMKTTATATPKAAKTGPFPAWLVAVLIAIASTLVWFIWQLKANERHD